MCKASQTERDSAVSMGRVEAFLRALNMDLTKIAEHSRELEELLQSREVQHQNNVGTLAYVRDRIIFYERRWFGLSFCFQMQKLFEELESHFREEQEKTKLEVNTWEILSQFCVYISRKTPDFSKKCKNSLVYIKSFRLARRLRFTAVRPDRMCHSLPVAHLHVQALQRHILWGGKFLKQYFFPLGTDYPNSRILVV